ncbi:MAG: hypothetical protein J6Y02_16555 [Pseudobutyrivibrio sp.]|nr:hypothetical protein [Pseudobutyrivibrio sp.]
MASRLELQELLENILGKSTDVWFQPPPSVVFNYPAIKYNLADIHTDKADNINYRKEKRYVVTLIHRDPDNTIVDDMIERGFVFDRFYAKDGLNHYVFMIYF